MIMLNNFLGSHTQEIWEKQVWTGPCHLSLPVWVNVFTSIYLTDTCNKPESSGSTTGEHVTFGRMIPVWLHITDQVGHNLKKFMVCLQETKTHWTNSRCVRRQREIKS